MGNKTDRDRMIINGVVSQAHKGGLFSVEIEGNIVVMAKPCGKIQKNLIKIIVGDKVVVELSPYDITKGRIITRLKG